MSEWSVIKQLRAMFPREEWTYCRKWRRWDASSGWHVHLDCATNTFQRSDTGEVVFNSAGGLVLIEHEVMPDDGVDHA